MRRRSYVLALVLWMAVLLLYPPGGADIDIYRANAGRTLAGIPAFGQTDTLGRYLDYSGGQHAIYVVLTALPGGFPIYGLLLMLVALWMLNKVNVNAARIVAFLPPVFYVLGITSWEYDKLLFLVLPLGVLLLLRERTSLHSLSA